MSELAQTIVSALHLLAFTGECADAAYYPAPAVYPTDSVVGGEATGIVSIGNCALPTTVGMDAQTVIDTYLELAGDDEVVR